MSGDAGRRRAGSGPVPVTEAEFALLRDLIYRHSGIHLANGKAAMLAGRLSRRLRTLGLGSFEEYYLHLMDSGNSEEVAHMLDCITTNETHFFRESGQFQNLEDSVLPNWRREGDRGDRPKRIRAWSAACSSGEEAFSLAMVLLWHFPPEEGWKVEVLASDLSRHALQSAREARWPVEQSRHIPDRYLKRYMRRGTRSQIGWMCAVPEVSSVIRLARLNLHQDAYPAVGRFDLIFCRNVLIYFDEQARLGVLERMSKHLEPGGLLLLGHADFPGRALDSLQRLRPTMFRKPREEERSTT